MTLQEAKDQVYKKHFAKNGEMWMPTRFQYSKMDNEAAELYADAKAKDESSKFAHWLANLPIREMVTVNPPAGSGGSHGIYELTFEQLYEKYQNSQL